MPRRHRSARERHKPEAARPPGGTAAARLQAPGYVVRESSKGPYPCGGCNQRVGPGPHVVVFPDDDPESRRHWHTPCWEREIRRMR